MSDDKTEFKFWKPKEGETPKVILVGEPAPFLVPPSLHGGGPVIHVPEASCPICEQEELLRGLQTEEKKLFSVLDPQRGAVSVVMDQKEFDKVMGNVFPSGRSLWFRVWRLEVRFWPMWWKLPLWNYRHVTASDKEAWMFGPWEFVRWFK